MKNSVVKILGERNTGTNYLDRLLRDNYYIDSRKLRLSENQRNFFNKYHLGSLVWILHAPISLGWKHAVPYKNILQLFGGKNLNIIILSKNPYSFLTSLHKRPYDNYELKNLPFSTFLKTPCKSILKDNYGKGFKNPIKLWNIKNKAFAHLKDTFGPKVYYLKYEDLLQNPILEIEKIASHFVFRPQNDSISNIIQSTKSKELDYNYYKNYYNKKLWLNQFTEQDLRFVNAQLDLETMNFWGYEIISPSTIKV